MCWSKSKLNACFCRINFFFWLALVECEVLPSLPLTEYNPWKPCRLETKVRDSNIASPWHKIQQAECLGSSLELAWLLGLGHSLSCFLLPRWCALWKNSGYGKPDCSSLFFFWRPSYLSWEVGMDHFVSWNVTICLFHSDVWLRHLCLE